MSLEPRLLNLMRLILGKNILLDFTQVRIDDSQNDRLLPFHQEMFGQMSRTCLTAWAALRDVTVEGGALRILPGSHKKGFVPHRFYPEFNNYHGVAETVPADKVIHLTASAGDIVVFHPLLFHASSPNQLDQIRWTFITRYNPIAELPYLEDENAPKHIPQA
jgi:ectoine hydroxylase-related dioxygenase (phytanoyl-CoA dioxygenase family)